MYKFVIILLILFFLFLNLKLYDNIIIIASLVLLLLLYSLFLRNKYDKFSSVKVESSNPQPPPVNCYSCTQ